MRDSVGSRVLSVTRVQVRDRHALSRLQPLLLLAIERRLSAERLISDCAMRLRMAEGWCVGDMTIQQRLGGARPGRLAGRCAWSGIAGVGTEAVQACNPGLARDWSGGTVDVGSVGGI